MLELNYVLSLYEIKEQKWSEVARQRKAIDEIITIQKPLVLGTEGFLLFSSADRSAVTSKRKIERLAIGRLLFQFFNSANFA